MQSFYIIGVASFDLFATIMIVFTIFIGSLISMAALLRD